MSAAVMPWYTSVSFHTGFNVFFSVFVRSLFAWGSKEEEWYENILMEREGSKEEKRNGRCFKGEGANSSDHNIKKRIKEHEERSNLSNVKDQERRREKEWEGGRERGWGGVGHHHLSLPLRKSQTSAAYFIEESERTQGFPLFTCPSVSSPIRPARPPKQALCLKHSSQLNCTTHPAWKIKAFQGRKCSWALNSITIHK